MPSVSFLTNEFYENYVGIFLQDAPVNEKNNR